MVDEAKEVKLLVVKADYTRGWCVALQVADKDTAEIVEMKFDYNYGVLQALGHDTPTQAVEAFAHLVSKLARKEAL